MKTKTSLHKSTILLIALSACFILLYACQEDSTIEILEEQEYQRKIEAYEQKIKDLEEKLGQEKSNDDRPGNLISFNQALTIYKEYDSRADLISDAVGTASGRARFEPTRSLFYDISELRKYLKHVDHLSEKAGVKPTGLRFYFALYPSSYVSSDGNDMNARHQTIFIAPTLEKKHENRIVHVGYTLDNNFEIKLLDRNNGFSYLRRNRSHGDLFTSLEKSGEDDLYSLLANELGATPPEWGGE